jgi:hypothetical protein
MEILPFRQLLVCGLLATSLQIGVGPAASVQAGSSPSDAQTRLVPKPKPKPAVRQPDISQPAKPDEPKPSERPSGHALNDTQAGPPTVSAACRAVLLELGVDFFVPDRVDATGECNVVDPVQLRSIQTSVGRVDLPGLPILTCPFAKQFGTWLSDIAAPVVAALAQSRLSSLSTGPGYECRGRTGDSSGKISEHGFGNAIDIAGLTLANEKRIEVPSVADTEGPDHRLLMALRISACGYFTTVLGPGSNAAHASHFHFDLGKHGKSGTYRICE